MATAPSGHFLSLPDSLLRRCIPPASIPAARRVCRKLKKMLEGPWIVYRGRKGITVREKLVHVKRLMEEHTSYHKPLIIDTRVPGQVEATHIVFHHAGSTWEVTYHGYRGSWAEHGFDRIRAEEIACNLQMGALYAFRKKELAMENVMNRLRSSIFAWEFTVEQTAAMLRRRGIGEQRVSVLLTRELLSTLRHLSDWTLTSPNSVQTLYHLLSGEMKEEVYDRCRRYLEWKWNKEYVLSLRIPLEKRLYDLLFRLSQPYVLGRSAT